MAQFIVDIADRGFEEMGADEARQFLIENAIPAMMETFTMCKSVVPPAEVPRGGEFGCSASTAGGGSISCGGTIRW